MTKYFQLINNNASNIFLFLISFTFPLGIYFFPIQTPLLLINGFHLVLYFSLIYLKVSKQIKLFIGKSTRYYLILLAVWLLYGFCGLLWAKEIKPVLQDMFGLINAIGILIALQSLLVLNNFRIKPFIQGWFTALAVVGIIGLLETETAYHLDKDWIAVIMKLPIGHSIRYVPIATFGNPNNYAVYLIFSLPLLLMLRNTTTAISAKWISLLCMLWIILLTQSRLGIFSFLLLLVISLFMLKDIDIAFIKKQIHPLVNLYIPIILVALLIIALFNWPFLQHLSFSSYFYTNNNVANSDQTRVGLIQAGLEMFVASHGLGVGGGNFPYYINQHLVSIDTYGSCNPHNWPIEVLSQYGIGIFTLLATFAIYIINQYIQLLNRFKNKGIFKFVTCGILLGIGYLIMSIDPSNFMRLPMNWILLSMIVTLVDCLHENASEFYDQNNMPSHIGSPVQ